MRKSSPKLRLHPSILIPIRLLSMGLGWAFEHRDELQKDWELVPGIAAAASGATL